jgi:hypothetical protein
LVLKTKYDDNVEIYLNGEKIFACGCCSANKEILLSKAIEQKLRKGKMCWLCIVRIRWAGIY